MSIWIDIASLNDIPKRGARVVKTRFGCIAIFRTHSDEVFAMDDACPHKLGPLSEGIVHDTSVTCPLHGWVFDLNTGQAKGQEDGRVTTYGIRVENGQILLDATKIQALSVA